MIRDLHLNEEVITKERENERTREEFYAHIQQASFESKTKVEFVKILKSKGLDLSGLKLGPMQELYRDQTEAIFKIILILTFE